MLILQNHNGDLKFPPGCRGLTFNLHYPPPTPAALDLMQSLLKEKTCRLGAKPYNRRLNRDRRPSVAPRPPLIVAPEDATEIKAHPFFEGIQWDQLHLMQPPFIPQATEDFSKYFEDEEQLVNCIGTSYMSRRARAKSDAAPEINEKVMGPYFERWENEQRQTDKIRMGLQGLTDDDYEVFKRNQGPIWNRIKKVTILNRRQVLLEQGIDPDAEVKNLFGPRPVMQRPRDIMLRDRKVGRRVLERRKTQAFLGYSYRSPCYVFPEVGKEYGPVYVRPTTTTAAITSTILAEME
jgi:protein-serine/threonine kinase